MPPKIPVGKCATCSATDVKIRPNPFNPKKLQCEDCREGEIIGITALQQIYGLKPADLEDLKMVKEPQPAFLNRPDKKWYLIAEVEKRARAVEKEKAKAKREKEKKADEKKRVKKEREEEKRIAREEREEERRIAREEKEENRRKREAVKEEVKRKREDEIKAKRGVATKFKASKRETVAEPDPGDDDFIVYNEGDLASQDYEPTSAEVSRSKFAKYGGRPVNTSENDDSESSIDPTPPPTPPNTGIHGGRVFEASESEDSESSGGPGPVPPSKSVSIDTKVSVNGESKSKKLGRPSKASKSAPFEEEDTETDESQPKFRRAHLPSKATPYPKNLIFSSDDDSDTEARKNRTIPNRTSKAEREGRLDYIAEESEGTTYDTEGEGSLKYDDSPKYDGMFRFGTGERKKSRVSHKKDREAAAKAAAAKRRGIGSRF